ncbi:MAG: deoxyribonuclease V [Dehalococcoidia bacterium]|nr:deoxyribonuclease V [Dehalococcoidia bacterium]
MNNGLHTWVMNTSQARHLQIDLSYKIVRVSNRTIPQSIAGVDVSISRFSKRGRAAVVVLSYPDMEILDLAMLEDDINFPYVPGLLSFREIPIILKAWQKLRISPDLVIVDGQGIAHPRRFGIASHLGLLLDIPSIGCAKSRLIGDHEPVADDAGSYSPLTDGEEIIGAVLRTRSSVKPVYVSIGHKIDLSDAISLVLKCCCGLRLPEPTRLAHLAAGQTGIFTVNTTFRGK